MPLKAGDRLGRFEIRAAIGAGGMGEVYRAGDPQLHREVAIKVLPEEFFDDAERRRRFEHEARAAGGLNHPNILAVFDVGVEGASSYIVTELLSGETLRERMDGRALPARKAIEYALQIAQGLAAAHDRGVVHRDIKPENLFVTTDGVVKILDFGLAKLSGPDSAGNTETISIDDAPETKVLGTAAYMSPEQARGLRVDHRTDIFSFGAVLYEMLTGFAPFRRATSAGTIDAVLHDEARPIPAASPLIAALERIVRHCLEKRPDERFQNFRDLAFQLQTVPLGTDAIPAAGGTGRSWRYGLGAAGVLLVLAVAVVGLVNKQWWPFQRSAAPEGLHRVRPITNAVGLEEYPAISPDGKMVAYTAIQQGRRQVFVQPLAGGSGSLPVTSNEADHQSPRWSPDSSTLVYFSPAGPGEVQGSIYKVPAFTGPSQRIIASIGGGDVSSEGRLACFRLEKDRIQLITSGLDGSEVRDVAQLETQHYASPRWSPDNKWIAYQAGDGFRWDLYVVPAAGGGTPARLTRKRTIIRGLTWRPDSAGVVYASAEGSSLAYLPPLALWEVETKGGDPRQRTPPEAWYEQPDLHASGVMAVTRMQMRFSIWKFPFDVARGGSAGPAELVLQQTGYLATPAPSPSGGELAYLSDNGGHANVWVMPSRGPSRQVSHEDDSTVSVGLPAWSPDGRSLAYLSSKGNIGFDFGIWLVRPDGSDPRQIVPQGLSPAWSEDSRFLYYVERALRPIMRIAVPDGKPEQVRPELARNVIGVNGSTVYFVMARALIDGRPVFEILAAPLGPGPARAIKTISASQVPISWQVVNPSLSPDGRWLAMPLTDGFTTNIWAISTQDDRTVRVTNFGDRVTFIARRVSWSADGRMIYAAVGDGDADAVRIDGLFTPAKSK